MSLMTWLAGRGQRSSSLPGSCWCRCMQPYSKPMCGKRVGTTFPDYGVYCSLLGNVCGCCFVWEMEWGSRNYTLNLCERCFVACTLQQPSPPPSPDLPCNLPRSTGILHALCSTSAFNVGVESTTAYWRKEEEFPALNSVDGRSVGSSAEWSNGLGADCCGWDGRYLQVLGWESQWDGRLSSHAKSPAPSHTVPLPSYLRGCNHLTHYYCLNPGF